MIFYIYYWIYHIRHKAYIIGLIEYRGYIIYIEDILLDRLNIENKILDILLDIEDILLLDMLDILNIEDILDIEDILSDIIFDILDIEYIIFDI